MFSILDTTEELECNEIVMPLPHTGLLSMFSRGIVATVKRQQRDDPVMAVACNGIAEGVGVN